MNNQRLWFPIAVFLIASCGREFSAPPPAPQIESLTPAEGFMGDLAIISGANFAKDAEDNLVFFGTESARIQSGSESELVVEVPALDAGESVHVKVSTTLGQGTSPDPFLYQGPGHPVAEKLDHEIHIEWAPLAVTPVMSLDKLDHDPGVVVANYTGRTVSLVGTRSGVHVDFGVQNTPISVALAVHQRAYLAYLTTVEVTPGEDTLVDTHLQVISITATPDKSFPVFTPDSFDALPSLDGKRFQPFRVWSYCRDINADGLCLSTGIVVSDMFRPALLFLDVGQNQPSGIRELGKNGCPAPERTVHFSDLRYDRQNDRFLATLQNSPEIWSVPATGTDCPQRLWPPEEPGSDPAEWSRRFDSLVLNRNSTSGRAFLYAADIGTNTLVEFEFADDVGNPDADILTQGRSTPLWNGPYAMAVARVTADHARLYVACGNGIIAFDPDTNQDYDVTGPLPVAVTIPLPACRGGPQSLGLIGYVQTAASPFRPDEIVFTDTVRDVVRIFPAGAEWTEAWDIPLGVTAPQVATSRFSDTLYLADPMANVIRLIDRNSGIQTDQFPIFDEPAFGSVDVACLDAGGADILLVPLPVNLIDAEQSRTPFDRIVVRRAGQAEDIQRWIESGYDYTGDTGVHTENLLQEDVFHEMLPAQKTRALYLVRYGSKKGPGRLWALEFNQDSPLVDSIILGEDDRESGPVFGFIDIELDPSVQLVRLNADEDIIALFDQPKDRQPKLIAIPLADPGSTSLIPVNEQLSQIVSDMTLRTGAAGTTFYLSLPPLGQVAVVEFDGQTHFIETTGVPSRLFISPDERRLYVSHHGVGKLSIIDIDCGQTPGCERVLTNVAVEPFPGEVIFHPSGKAAFLTHYLNNSISVIE
jgi:hypothetical protein